jgi:hypothetical protein
MIFTCSIHPVVLVLAEGRARARTREGDWKLWGFNLKLQLYMDKIKEKRHF